MNFDASSTWVILFFTFMKTRKEADNRDQIFKKKLQYLKLHFFQIHQCDSHCFLSNGCALLSSHSFIGYFWINFWDYVFVRSKEFIFFQLTDCEWTRHEHRTSGSMSLWRFDDLFRCHATRENISWDFFISSTSEQFAHACDGFWSQLANDSVNIFGGLATISKLIRVLMVQFCNERNSFRKQFSSNL